MVEAKKGGGRPAPGFPAGPGLACAAILKLEPLHHISPHRPRHVPLKLLLVAAHHLWKGRG